jgi:hypothetical protein
MGYAQKCYILRAPSWQTGNTASSSLRIPLAQEYFSEARMMIARKYRARVHGTSPFAWLLSL